MQSSSSARLTPIHAYITTTHHSHQPRQTHICPHFRLAHGYFVPRLCDLSSPQPARYLSCRSPKATQRRAEAYALWWRHSLSKTFRHQAFVESQAVADDAGHQLLLILRCTQLFRFFAKGRMRSHNSKPSRKSRNRLPCRLCWFHGHIGNLQHVLTSCWRNDSSCEQYILTLPFAVRLYVARQQSRIDELAGKLQVPKSLDWCVKQQYLQR